MDCFQCSSVRLPTTWIWLLLKNAAWCAHFLMESCTLCKVSSPMPGIPGLQFIPPVIFLTLPTSQSQDAVRCWGMNWGIKVLLTSHLTRWSMASITFAFFCFICCLLGRPWNKETYDMEIISRHWDWQHHWSESILILPIVSETKVSRFLWW